MKKQNRRRFIPTFERLEDRWVPAGNINIAVDHGVLYVIGDEEANDLSIVGLGNGKVSVSSGDDVTTINGEDGPLVFSGVKNGLFVNLKEGDDNLVVSNLALRKELAINLNEGNDKLTLMNVSARHHSAIAGLGGDDMINIVGSSFRQRLTIHAGDGDDVVNLANSSFGPKSRIDGNAGFDSIGYQSNRWGRNAKVEGFEDSALGTYPTALGDEGNVDEGDSTVINLAANDSTIFGTIDLDSIVIITQPTNGTIDVNNDGTVTYTHDGSETTSDTFEYTINNSSGNPSNIATVVLTINPVNDAPVAGNDAATLAEGGNAIINVASNDTDVDGTINLASIVVTTQPTNGALVINNNGTVTYTHNGSETTSDSFAYTIKDNNGLASNIATVAITVTPVNDAPVAVNDAATLDEGGNSIVNVASNDTDVDGTIDLTSIVVTTQPVNGSLVINNDGTVTYTHNGSETTSDTFAYTINDNNGLASNIATVAITVTPVNDAPVAVDDAATLDEGGNAVVNVASNDTDADGTLDLVSLIVTAQPTNGTAIVNNDGTITYTHNGSETTTDSFTYTINDNNGLTSNIATVTITINPINDAPVAVDDGATLDEGGNILVNLAGNDSDVDGTLDLTSIVITTPAANGAVLVNNDGTVTYTHNGSETTSDSFSYTILDNNGLVSNIATVTITVNPVNDAPVAVDDAANVANAGNVNINLAGNDTDVDGTVDLTSIVITTPATNGNVVINGDGTVTYTHDGSATNSDTFSYTILDNLGLVSNIGTVTVTIA